MTIKLNSVDITDKLELSTCNLYDRLGGMADNLKISFPYGSEITFNKFDVLEITADQYKTGQMYIVSCNGTNNNSVCVINALSYLPSYKNKRSRLLSNITLFQVINDVANSYGLKPKIYDVTNYNYASICQLNETDLQFLNRICQREGYSVKLDDGCLIVFNDYSLENNYEDAKITKADVSSFDFKRIENGLRSMTVRHYSVGKRELIKYTATDDSFGGGAETATEFLTGIDEAERFAKGYLRAKNNTALTGSITMEFNTALSAGTTITLTDFEDYDGRYIIYELRHDVINHKTHLKIRKTLNY